MMTRERFKGILWNLHFNDNANTQDEGRGYKDSDKQSIDEYMVKFKGRSAMK